MKSSTIIILTTLVLFFCINQAFCVTPEAICNRYKTNSTTPGLREDCLREVKGGIFDKRALQLCSDIPSIVDGLGCVTGIKDAVFQSEALEYCSELIGENISAGGSEVYCILTIGNSRFKPTDFEDCDSNFSYLEDALYCLNRKAVPVKGKCRLIDPYGEPECGK